MEIEFRQLYICDGEINVRDHVVFPKGTDEWAEWLKRLVHKTKDDVGMPWEGEWKRAKFIIAQRDTAFELIIGHAVSLDHIKVADAYMRAFPDGQILGGGIVEQSDGYAEWSALSMIGTYRTKPRDRELAEKLLFAAKEAVMQVLMS